MKILKNRNFKLLLIAIIVVLIFFLCAIDSKAQEQIFEPISYDFQNNVLYDKDGSFMPELYNIREQSEYNGHYEAFESFEKDSSGNEPQNWISDNDIDCSSTIISSINSHNNILELYDNNNDGTALIYTTITQGLDTIFEFWVGKNDTSSDYRFNFMLYEGNSRIVYILLSNDDLIYYYTSTYQIIKYDFIEPNVLIHIRLELDDTNNQFDCYVNNILEGNDLLYENTSNFGVNKIVLETHRTDLDYKGYVDSIDYSYHYGYYENRNLVPIKEYTNQYEVDKYEFDYNSNEFESDLYSWKQNEYNETTNDIQIKVASEQTINKHIMINTPAYPESYKNGIQFNDNSNAYIINVSLSMEIYFKDVWCAHLIYIFTQNINLNYPIAMKFNGATNSIDVYNISSLAFESFSTFTTQVIYEVNFYLNYYDNIMVISLNSTEGFVKGIYPLDDNDKWNNLYGLDYIQINNSISSMGDYATTYLYNVGIYEKGKYFQSTLDNREFGLMIYEIDDTWNSLDYNLITVNSENDYKLYVSDVYVKFDEGYQLRSRNIQFEREVINIQAYGKEVFSYILPCLVFMLFDNFSIPYEIEIEGVSLVDNNDISSNAIYIYDNTYPSKYYFYCIDNKLYYNFSNSYKLGIETMTIVFDVKDVLLDKSFLFAYKSYITDEYNGFITLESYGFYESFNIPNDIKPINSVYNVSLQEQFTLTEIRIHIKTDIDDFASGYTNGYIQNLNLYYDVPLEPDYDPISILELDFIESMIFIVIRLIFFLIPSLAFRTKFGNKSILPIWLLIGFVLFISGLIPFWLFFIQIIAIGSMLMLNRNKEVD